jgi:uncharacterized SAM-binding protein YcdF (DUF218 family)
VESEEVRSLAKVLWNYHRLSEELPSEVDLLLVTGSHDDRVAVYGAELSKQVSARALVASGGYGKITADTLSEPEGQRFRKIMVEHGVPEGRILVEDTATNTGENVTRTRELLKTVEIAPSTAIIVTKPYMERRAFATAMKQWPEVHWYAASPKIEFEDYPSDEVPERRMIELMVGDLQRIKVYGEKGFQISQEIPDAVWKAYEKLVGLGYDKQVIR